MSDQLTVHLPQKPPTTIGDALIVICGALGFFVPWVIGVVLAKGFWSTLVAIFIFPWAWYLTAEMLLIRFGLIPGCG